MYNIVMYYYVLIVFSLRRESLKLILAMDPFRGGSVTVAFMQFGLIDHLRAIRFDRSPSCNLV
jgi:hypothetical protein